MSFKLTELQEKWLQALESGEYPQQRNALLQDSTGFCCLGVACEVVGVCSFPDDRDLDTGAIGYGIDRCTAFPPHELVDALHLRLGKGTTTLIEMNDAFGRSFPEIAAEVRANPADYFTKGAE